MPEAIYHVFTRIEERPDGCWAVAVAIPENQPLRCAPARREARCPRRADAPSVAARIARQLAAELGRCELRCDTMLQ